MISASEALDRLRAGNQRFASDECESESVTHAAHRIRLAEGQEPFATILGCSDSRVPAELVFDQGLGDLFVIRVAGNIVASSQLASVEFAATAFGTPLVVVLGHTECGAVSATFDQLRQAAPDPSPNLRSIVDRIRPSVEAVLTEHSDLDRTESIARAVRANVGVAVEHLRKDSPILTKLIAADNLTIVGAEYCLETGLVEFFDGA